MTEGLSTSRTRNYIRQIGTAAVFKSAAILASLVSLPLMIDYLGAELFGVWSTLLAVMTWLVFFDLGVGNGLRNKVGESLARNRPVDARLYISNGYSAIALLSLAFLALAFSGSYFISWQSVFNTRAVPEADLRITFQIVAFFIIVNFWIGLVHAVLGALQRTSVLALGQLITNVLVLTFVIRLGRSSEASLIQLAAFYGISIVTSNLLLSLIIFGKRPELLPRPAMDAKYARPLLAVGSQFFLIQLAVLVIFSTDKILIAQIFGPETVTSYDVVFRIFGTITLVHGLLSAPLWSAYTDAFHRGDLSWIHFMLRRQFAVFCALVLVVIALALLARPIISVWIQKELDIQPLLIGGMAAMVVVSCWNNMFAMIVNGIGALKLQLITAVAGMILNIPLSIYLAAYTGLGPSGIAFGTICSLSFSAVALPLQVRRLSRNE